MNGLTVDHDSPIADPGKRLGAAAIDLAAAVLIPSLVALTGFALRDRRFADAVPWVALANWVAVFSIQTLLLARDGQTIGKRRLGIRILRSDGTRAGIGRIVFLRFLPFRVVGIIPLVGPLATIADHASIFGADRRALHDRAADTIVVSIGS